jgi:glycogen debranching enzyme
VQVEVGRGVLTLHEDDRVLVCAADGSLSSAEAHGLYVRDTRLVSDYAIELGGSQTELLASSEISATTGRFELTNAELPELAGGSLHLRLDRVVGNGVRESYRVANHAGRAVEVELAIRVAFDFADLFEARDPGRPSRGLVKVEWNPEHATVTARYESGAFRRAVRLRSSEGPRPDVARRALVWRLSLPPGESRSIRLLWEPAREDGVFPDAILDREPAESEAAPAWTSFTTGAGVAAIVDRSVEDLAGLRLRLGSEDDSYVPAAGVPWFAALFGRDALVVSLQTLGLTTGFALGSLRALGRLQGDGYDDARDMQPGKIEHEVRHGELAALGLIPHTPYYGTHEATTLYVWTAARAWRWHGDRGELDAVRPHVERALAWIDRDGDLDGDGLQEYRTRAGAAGYYNQGWKDSGEAIVDERGQIASLPIALCEHQGYVVAAKRAWAEVLAEVYGEHDRAGELRAAADRLAGLIDERFWWEEEGTYFLGLDGAKKPLRSVTSNPGHLLWAGAVPAERAERVAGRLLEDDLWSGWGIRTLSSRHPAYNPLSYQRGAVWPHDCVIAAAGLRRYGLDEPAWRVLRGVFDAAARFRAGRLPELYAGLARDEAGLPAPYPGANVPQAWAAGAIVHALDVLLGLEPDAPRQLLRLSPALPDWLPELRLEGLAVGRGTVDLTAARTADGGSKLEVDSGGSVTVRLAER